MAKEVIMPKFGFTQETAEIVKWLKREGDAVEMGDPIAEVTTDKVDMEVEAVESGILAGLQYREGDIVPVTQVIAYILKPGESLPTATGLAASTAGPLAAPMSAGSAPPSETTPSPAAPAATPVAQRVAQDLGVNLSQVSGTGPGGRVTRGDVEAFARQTPALAVQPAGDQAVRATPAARRVARETDVDLRQVPGTGPRGRIQGEDVRGFAERLTTASSAAAPSPAAPAAAPAASPAARVVRMTSMRRTIAERLQQSFQQSPHIFFDADIDVTALEALRQRAAQLPASPGESAAPAKVSMTALIVRIVAWALARHPYVNSRLEGDSILLLEEVNVGVAVALESGLIVPVVRNATHKSVFQLAKEIAELAERARTGRLSPDDVMGGTFTVSNLGMFGVDRFTAIINPPQAAILAISRTSKRFVPDANDQPVVRPIMTITLSADHRIIDGAVAARFLSDLRLGLEHPELVLL